MIMNNLSNFDYNAKEKRENEQNSRIGKRKFKYMENEKNFLKVEPENPPSEYMKHCFNMIFGKIETIEEAIRILKRDWFI